MGNHGWALVDQVVQSDRVTVQILRFSEHAPAKLSGCQAPVTRLSAYYSLHRQPSYSLRRARRCVLALGLRSAGRDTEPAM